MLTHFGRSNSNSSTDTQTNLFLNQVEFKILSDDIKKILEEIYIHRLNQSDESLDLTKHERHIKNIITRNDNTNYIYAMIDELLKQIEIRVKVKIKNNFF